MPHPLDSLVPPPAELPASEALGWTKAIAAAKDATIVLNDQPLYEGQIVIRIHAVSQGQAERILGEIIRLAQWRREIKDVIVKDTMRLVENRREELS